MTEAKTAGDRRAQHVALFGCLLQAAACVLLITLARWAGRSHLLLGLAHFISVGVPIWLILYLILNQMRRVGLEARETEELRRAQASGTSQAIFELDDEALLLEQNRVRWMIRWLLPGGTIFVALFIFIGHLLQWGWRLDGAFDENVLQRTTDPSLTMWFVIVVGFLCFLYARYALALARLPQWGLIRAGAACMAGSGLASVLVAITLMASGTLEWVEPVAAYIIPLALLILGGEFVGNFILDLYRPRVPEEVPRPSFDSRLLGMIGEPGGIAKSIADAANYQFGFQVSSTWFYQLLQRWLFPICVVAFASVIALSSVVLVDAGDEVVVERFGRPHEGPNEILAPGIHLKWPYPVEVVYRVPTGRISELVVGEIVEDEEHGEDEGEHDDHGDVILWTQQHDFVAEFMLLVASPRLETLSAEVAPVGLEGIPVDQAGGTESVAVSLLMASVPIEYRVKDVHKYLYKFVEPEKLLEEVAYRFLSDYAASVDIDELMGPGRGAFNRVVKRELQTRLDELDVGIEILFVGIRDAHPPSQSKVAETFQAVVAAETLMRATINAAEGAAKAILTRIAGTESRARALDEAILAREKMTRDSPELNEAAQRVEDLLVGNPEKGIAPISGDASARIAQARAGASNRVSRAAAKAMAFGTQLAAHRAAPNLYRQRKWLEIYDQLDSTRKYLITGDPGKVIIEQDTAREAGLDEVLTEGVQKERDKRQP